MKTLLIVSVVVVFLVAGLYFLALQSKTSLQLGLLDGRLLPCAQMGNCVNSMEGSVDPLVFKGDIEHAWSALLQTIDTLGGHVEHHEDNYLWVTFRSPIFGFVDDVEFLFEPELQRFQVRSASRVGRSDFSANRNRVEALRKSLDSSKAG